jgi:hypothetical protein
MRIRRGNRGAVEVPRLTTYATSWLRSRLPALKASTAATYAEVLDSHVLPPRGYYLIYGLMDYSHVDRAETRRAADKVVALAGLRAPANDVDVPNAPASGGSGGDSTDSRSAALSKRRLTSRHSLCGREDLNFHTLAGTRT